MKKLILLGDIGCGKSTLIRNAVGEQVSLAGGFVTRRVTEDGKVLGFDLSSPRIWADPDTPARRFLDLEQNLRDDRVFAQWGVALLENALRSPFAVADEFGGLELLIPQFRDALLALLASDVPVIGVLKTPAAAKALAAQTGLGSAYFEAYAALHAILEADPHTLLLPMTGWADENAVIGVRSWTAEHLRR